MTILDDDMGFLRWAAGAGFGVKKFSKKIFFWRGCVGVTREEEKRWWTELQNYKIEEADWYAG